MNSSASASPNRSPQKHTIPLVTSRRTVGLRGRGADSIMGRSAAISSADRKPSAFDVWTGVLPAMPERLPRTPNPPHEAVMNGRDGSSRLIAGHLDALHEPALQLLGKNPPNLGVVRCSHDRFLSMSRPKTPPTNAPMPAAGTWCQMA